MKVNATITLMITLAVGVLLTVGVLTPVIADAVASDNGGSGGSGDSANETYTNTGDIYLKSMSAMDENEFHFISFVTDNDKIQMRYDGELYLEKDIVGTDAWYIPILIFPVNDELMIVTFERCFDASREPVLVYRDMLLETYEGTPAADMTNSAYITYLSDSNVYEFQVLSTGVDLLIDNEISGSRIPSYNMAFSGSAGDWVLSENPVISADKEAYLFGNTAMQTDGSNLYQIIGYGKGNASYYNGFYLGRCGEAYNTDLDLEYIGYAEAEIIRTETTSLNGGATRLGATAYQVDFFVNQDWDNVVFSEQVSFNTYIVPVTVTGGTEVQSGWLSNNFSDLPSDGGLFYVTRDDATHVSVYADYLNPNQYTVVPFYEYHDLTVSPLVIAFGEDWCAFVDQTCLINVTDGSDAPIHISGWHTLAACVGVAPDGSAAYQDVDFGSGFTTLQTKALGYISPNGTMKTYYNQNAPKSDSLYTWISDSTITEESMSEFTLVTVGGFTDPSIGGLGIVREGGDEPVVHVTHSPAVTKSRGYGVTEYDLSAVEYRTNGNMVTGLTATFSSGGDTVERSYSLTGQTPAALENDAPYPTGTMMVCIVPTGTEYTDGGNGSGGEGLSDSLAAMLSVIPLLVVTGMIFMAFTIFKGGQ